MRQVRYRAALIGCGAESRKHSRALQAARGVELVALVDVFEPNLRTAGAAYGVDRLYTNLGQMLTRERPDIVAICTQAPQHAPIVIAAAEAGVKAILCEKPIATTLEEADAMLAACGRSGTRLAINHQTRVIPSTYAVERLLRERTIGDLRAARLLDKGGRPAGNSIVEMGTHMFDLLRLYAGDPQWVAAHFTVGPGHGGTDDHHGPQRPATIDDVVYSQTAFPKDRDCGLVIGSRASVTFGFGPRDGWHHGLTATFESFFQQGPLPSGGAWLPNLELLGTDGALFLHSTSGFMDVYLHRGPWAPPGRLERIDAPAHTVALNPAAGDVADVPHHVAMVEELVAALAEGREHRSNGLDGRWALEMIHGAFESHHRDGARIDLPLSHRGHPLERWLAEEGRPLPERPASATKPLRVPVPV
jgi:predicted dehydrogenase